MALSEDEILVLTRLLGEREFVGAALAEAGALEELGLAADTTGLSFERTRRRGFLMSQTLFTLRRLSYGVTLAFVGTGIAAAKWGFDFNSAMQQARVALQPVFKDTGGLQRQLNYLFNFTKYTPFQFKDITIAFRQMYGAFQPLGISVGMTNQTIKAMVDALAFVGRNTPGALNRVAVALQHMAFQGRLTGQTTLQLARDGLPIYAALRKELGLTADQMHHVGQLGIPTMTVLQALIKYIESTPGYANAAHRQATRTLHGLFTTFKDNLSQIMGAIELGFFGRMQSGLNRMNNWFNRFSAVVKSGNMDKIMRAIGGPGAVLVWNQIAGAVRDAWSAFKIFTAELTQSKIVWGTIITLLVILRGALWFVAQNAHLWANALKILLPLFLLYVTYQKAMVLWTGIFKTVEIATTAATKELTFAQLLLAVAMGRYELMAKAGIAVTLIYATVMQEARLATWTLSGSIDAALFRLRMLRLGMLGLAGLTISAIVLLTLVPRAKRNPDPNAPSNLPLQQRLTHIPLLGPAFSQVGHAADALSGLMHRIGIPGYQTGGVMPWTGWANVNEGYGGGELIRLPRGSRVIPSGQATGYSNAAGHGPMRQLVVQVVLPDKRVLAEAVTDVLATSGART